METYLNIEIAELLGWSDFQSGKGPETDFTAIAPDGLRTEVPDWSGEFFLERHPYVTPDYSLILSLVAILVSKYNWYFMLERDAVRLSNVGIVRTTRLSIDIALCIKLALQKEKDRNEYSFG